MAAKRIEKFTADWQPTPGFPNAFRYKKASFWKGQKGWWASRGEGDEIHGPFRGPRLAQAWAEEPYRLEWESRAELRQTKQAAKEKESHEKLEAHARETWGDLLPDQRELGAKQVWARRGESLASQQLLIVEVRKTTAIVKTRNDNTPWSKAPTDVREIREVVRLYRFVERAKSK